MERKSWLGTVNADSLPACVLRSTVEQARSLACSFSLYLFLRFLSQRELEDVLESSRKRKSWTDREREIERGVLESSIRKRSRKKGEDRNRSGYACVVEKKQEKKKTYG